MSPLGHRSYIEAALIGARHTGPATNMCTSPIAEEFIVTIDYSRRDGGEEAIDAVATRKGL